MKILRSLQSRITALVILLVSVIWIAVSAMTWFDARHELDELLDSHLTQAAALLVVQQIGEIEDDDHVDAPMLHRYATKVAFQVFHDGKLVLHSANAPTDPMAGSIESFKVGFRNVNINGVAWRIFATRGGKRDIQVYVGEQTGSRASILWAVLRSTLWPMLLALPLLAIVIGWAVHRGMVPLRQLGRSLSVRQPESLHAVSVDGSTTELMPLVDSLNGLFERIESLMASERRFTADAAHELRTPIAAIRAQAQVAMAEEDVEQRRHALQSTIEGCDRAARIIEQLLALAKLESGLSTEQVDVDLSSVVKAVIAEIAAHAVLKRQTIQVDVPAVCRLTGDAVLLTMLVRNLVDNAIRYCPPDAIICVTVENFPDAIMLIVEDSGPGMSESDRQQLGTRFFRVLGNDPSGSGLGWSIVTRISAAHHGSISAERSEKLGGLRVELRIPVGSAKLRA